MKSFLCILALTMSVSVFANCNLEVAQGSSDEFFANRISSQSVAKIIKAKGYKVNIEDSNDFEGAPDYILEAKYWWQNQSVKEIRIVSGGGIRLVNAASNAEVWKDSKSVVRGSVLLNTVTLGYYFEPSIMNGLLKKLPDCSSL